MKRIASLLIVVVTLAASVAFMAPASGRAGRRLPQSSESKFPLHTGTGG